MGTATLAFKTIQFMAFTSSSIVKYMLDGDILSKLISYNLHKSIDLDTFILHCVISFNNEYFMHLTPKGLNVHTTDKPVLGNAT
jgi:hypothetical protein